MKAIAELYCRTHHTNFVGEGGIKQFESNETAAEYLRAEGYTFSRMGNFGDVEREIWSKEVGQNSQVICTCCRAATVAECDTNRCGVARLNGLENSEPVEIEIEAEPLDTTCECGQPGFGFAGRWYCKDCAEVAAWRQENPGQEPCEKCRGAAVEGECYGYLVCSDCAQGLVEQYRQERQARIARMSAWQLANYVEYSYDYEG